MQRYDQTILRFSLHFSLPAAYPNGALVITHCQPVRQNVHVRVRLKPDGTR